MPSRDGGDDTYDTGGLIGGSAAVILEPCIVIGVNDKRIKLARTKQDEKGGGIVAIQHSSSERDSPPRRLLLSRGHAQHELQ